MAMFGYAKTKALILVATLMLPFSTRAELWCEGRVSRVMTYAMGDLMIHADYRGDWTAICNIETPRGGVPPGVCKNWFAQLSMAVALDKAVVVHYYDPSLQSCNTIPAYHAAPAPNYVHLVK
ncbi:UNVERIFIED_ORG: hypothetical protein LHJ69_23580 [Shinella sp. XGS7]|nr:hypothetical protein [Shinella sp. XGS7]